MGDEKNCTKKKCIGMPRRLFQSSVDGVANPSSMECMVSGAL